MTPYAVWHQPLTSDRIVGTLHRREILDHYEALRTAEDAAKCYRHAFIVTDSEGRIVRVFFYHGG